MYYEGYFRSIDTSVDNDGQLYKVVLFTHTGTDGYYTDTKGTLTLGARPFTVEYSGSNDTIFQNMKCSTASINILLDEINNDLITTKRNESMAFLLKWNNDVIEDDASYYNKVTTKKISKATATDADIDMFCYEIEWVGYITPNAYSQSFTDPHDTFTIECQDALSTLKYFDVDKTEDTNTFLSAITIALSHMERVYKDIYVTTSIKLPSLTDTDDTRKNRILEHLMLIWENFYDEDDTADSFFAMLEEMMCYLNLTMIPYKDSLIIANYDAIGNTLMEYNLYKAQEKRYIYGQESGIKMSLKYTYVGECVMGTQNTINADTFCSTATKISLTDTYKKVKLTTDEYYSDSLTPDFDDEEQIEADDNFEMVITGAVPDEDSTPSIKHISTDFYFDTLWDDTHYIYAGSLLKKKPFSIDKNITNYATWETPAYGLDQWAASHAFMPTTPIYDNADFQTMREVQQYVCCAPIEYSIEEFKTATTFSSVCRSYSPSRAWYFNTPTLTNYSDDDLHRYDPYVYLKPTYYSIVNNAKQILLRINSKKTYMRSSQYLNIKGDWEFFMGINKNDRMTSTWSDGTHTMYLARPVPTQNNMTTKTYDGLKGDLGHMFVWARINIAGRWWLANDTNSYNYHWEEDTTTPTAAQRWCKLYYGGAGYTEVNEETKGIWWWKRTTYESAVNAFDTKFSFINNTRGTDGICVKLPSFGNNNALYDNVEIEFARPFGCCLLENNSSTQFIWSRSSLLSNFEMNIISEEDIKFRTSNTDDKDSEFDVLMDNQATNDEYSKTLKLSSNYKKDTNKSAVFKYNTDGNSYQMDMITNLGIRLNALPEVEAASSIARNHTLPNTALSIDTHKDVTPFDVFRWSHFVDGTTKKVFMVNMLSIDYEYNTRSVDLMSKSDVGQDNIRFKQKVKTYRRNGTIISTDTADGIPETIGAVLISTVFSPTLSITDGNVTGSVIGTHPLETSSFEINDEDLLFVVPDEYESTISITAEDNSAILEY